MQTNVIRSHKRHKSVQARMVEGTLQIRIPAHFDATQEAHWVEEMQRRFTRRSLATRVDLVTRSTELADELALPIPRSITWSSRQRTLWGSCTPATGAIRISDRLASFPAWVIDYVIVHELAHLEHANHTKAFWELVDRHDLSERARGYLIAKADGVEPCGTDSEA